MRGYSSSPVWCNVVKVRFERSKQASSKVFSQFLPFVASTRFWGVCFRSQRQLLARLMGEFLDGFFTVVAATAMLYRLRGMFLQQWFSSYNSPVRREDSPCRATAIEVTLAGARLWIAAFISRGDFYLIDGVAINGVSGGPVFTDLPGDQPEVFGTISAYMPNRQLADTLPGILQAHDVTSFQQMVRKIKSLDEGREEKEEQEKHGRRK